MEATEPDGQVEEETEEHIQIRDIKIEPYSREDAIEDFPMLNDLSEFRNTQPTDLKRVVIYNDFTIGIIKDENNATIFRTGYGFNPDYQAFVSVIGDDEEVTADTYLEISELFCDKNNTHGAQDYALNALVISISKNNPELINKCLDALEDAITKEEILNDIMFRS